MFPKTEVNRPTHDSQYSQLVDVSYKPGYHQPFLGSAKPIELVLHQSNFRPRTLTVDVGLDIYLASRFKGINTLPDTLQFAHVAPSRKEALRI